MENIGYQVAEVIQGKEDECLHKDLQLQIAKSSLTKPAQLLLSELLYRKGWLKNNFLFVLIAIIVDRPLQAWSEVSADVCALNLVKAEAETCQLHHEIREGTKEFCDAEPVPSWGDIAEKSQRAI